MNTIHFHTKQDMMIDNLTKSSFLSTSVEHITKKLIKYKNKDHPSIQYMQTRSLLYKKTLIIKYIKK